MRIFNVNFCNHTKSDLSHVTFSRIEQEIVTSPASSVANSEISIASPEPVPAALLMPSKKGTNCIQTMYVTPTQQLKPHFLLSSGTPKSGDSPEYLVPDKTDNPLLELVHDAEPDENGEYITIVTGDGTEVGSPVPASLLAETELESVLGSKANKKKTTTPRRRTRKETAPPLPAPKITGIRKIERKKKPTLSKCNADNVLSSNEFLFDIDLDKFVLTLFNFLLVLAKIDQFVTGYTHFKICMNFKSSSSLIV